MFVSQKKWQKTKIKVYNKEHPAEPPTETISFIFEWSFYIYTRAYQCIAKKNQQECGGKWQKINKKLYGNNNMTWSSQKKTKK